MLIALRIAIGLLLLDLILLGIFSIQLIFGATGTSPSSLITPSLIASGVLTALISFLAQNVRKNSEEYLENSLKLLEKAYDALNIPDKDGHRPLNSRINWLTSARLLRTSEIVSEYITEPHHRRIYLDQREFWRGRFHDLIMPDSIQGLPSTYYAERPEHMHSFGGDDRESIAETSLAVLYRFVRWPKGFEDAIRDEPKFSDEEIEKMVSFGPRGLGELLQAARAWKRHIAEQHEARESAASDQSQ